MFDLRDRSHSYPGAKSKQSEQAQHASSHASSGTSSGDSSWPSKQHRGNRYQLSLPSGVPSRARRTLMRLSEVKRPPMSQLERK